ncbi:MAG: hypothetical protein OP8BY_1271 [Candidatus Saccharicenans subterraneus]|uniref:Uncharacterized protein n=1 Tax=Candidatus Saccharicenans subterraneus TaxID=2508984 RepID=A0A3E2BPL5_9BACT|nr:MAG: hypothetical protein OP8BY_1271 [Candidatus Saccharicenans subterraneum]
MNNHSYIFQQTVGIKSSIAPGESCRLRPPLAFPETSGPLPNTPIYLDTICPLPGQALGNNLI